MIVDQTTDITLQVCNTNPASSVLFDFGDQDVRAAALGSFLNHFSKNYSSVGIYKITATFLIFNATFQIDVPGIY